MNEQQAKYARLPVWRMVVMSSVIALAAALCIIGLNRWASRMADTETHLVRLQGDLNSFDGLEWRATSRKAVDDELADAIEATRRRVMKHLDEIDLSGELEALPGLVKLYTQSVEKELALIRAGHPDDARAFDESNVDPAFDKVSKLIRAAAVAKRATVARVSRAAEAGMVLSMLLAACAATWMFARSARASERHARELKQAIDELRQTQDQLVQTGKLAALGQLVAGIAHEVNTPIGAIRTAASNANKALKAAMAAMPELGRRLHPAQQEAFFGMLEHALASDPAIGTVERRTLRRALTDKMEAAGIDDARRLAELLVDLGVRAELGDAWPLLRHPDRDWLLGLAYDLTRLRANSDTILSASDRLATLVVALKNYARIEPQREAQPVDVRSSIETVLELYGEQLGQGVEIERKLDETAPVEGHVDELVQVWTNLVHNAMQAMDGRGCLRIASGHRDGTVVVSVTDSGPGIPPELQKKIFEPFFTTKPRGEGTGLGLHICQQIVARHGGSIELDSQPGRTVFSVRLPPCKAPALTRREAPVEVA